eukprot:scaffold108710_cov43-Cyclotella_meneghiniana.AAC.1
MTEHHGQLELAGPATNHPFNWAEHLGLLELVGPAINHPQSLHELNGPIYSLTIGSVLGPATIPHANRQHQPLSKLFLR